MGETRPTNEDVEGAKNALFGVGKDESTNIRLLENYITQQEQLKQSCWKALSRSGGSTPAGQRPPLSSFEKN